MLKSTGYAVAGCWDQKQKGVYLGIKTLTFSLDQVLFVLFWAKVDIIHENWKAQNFAYKH